MSECTESVLTGGILVLGDEGITKDEGIMKDSSLTNFHQFSTFFVQNDAEAKCRLRFKCKILKFNKIYS